MRELDEDVQALIAEHGIRNALLTSIAPTGTISLVADNVSSGIEPVFALAYTRKVLQPDGSRTEEEVSDYALRRYRALHGETAALPDYFVTAQDLTPAEHVRMQAAVQRHVDSAISKTVNVPGRHRLRGVPGGLPRRLPQRLQGLHDLPPERGHRLGAGGQAGRAGAGGRGTCPTSTLMVRPEKVIGATYKLRWPDSEHAMYVTVNDIEQDGVRRPFEVFVNSKNLEHYAWVVALTRMISRGVPPRRRSGVRGRGAQAGVRPARRPMEQRPLRALAGRRDRRGSGAAHARDRLSRRRRGRRAAVADAARKPASQLGPLCPKCSQPGLVKEAGCLSCLHCGWSKCG